MHWIIVIAAVLLLVTCHDNERDARAARAAEDARIEREVARRVEIERKRLAGRDTLLHTVSWVVILGLTGGVVVRLLWVRRARNAESVLPVDRTIQTNQVSGIIQQPRPQWNDYQAPRVGRVIDLRTVTRPQPIQQPLQQEQPVWNRQRRRRRWNRDPGWQPNPPRRSR